MKKLGTTTKMLSTRRTQKSQTMKQKTSKKKAQVNFTGVKRLREDDLGDIEEMT